MVSNQRIPAFEHSRVVVFVGPFLINRLGDSLGSVAITSD